MKIIEARANLNMNGAEIKAGSRYMVSDGVACVIASAAVQVIADGRSWLRSWRGERLDGKSVIFHCAMGIGDEFQGARLASIIKRDYGADSVTLACFQSHHDFWKGSQGLPFSLSSELVKLEDWQKADAHVVHEGWWESFKHHDQPDCWETMERACGIKIAAADRFPLLPDVPQEMLDATRKMVEEWLQGRKLVLWVLGASSRIRSYAPFETHQAITKLTAKGYGVVAIGYPEQVKEYDIDSTEGVQIYSAGVPGLLSLVKAAATRDGGAVMVTPDSLAGHIASGYPSLPVVSLWSSFDPSKRVAGYANHNPIYRKARCSPCFAHEYLTDGRRTQTGCPLSSCNGYCHGLQSIGPDEIVDAIAKLQKGIDK